ncbi:MAG: thrombospondin type 3 repeat-containing protein [Tuberibacillus sp.]
MTRRLKRALVLTFILIAVIILGFGYLYTFCGYHEKTAALADADHDHISNQSDQDVDGDGIPNLKDLDVDGDGIENTKEIVNSASQLVGILYDPLKGGYGNIGGKMGFIVCIDVPRIAYEHAGIYFQDLLTEDFNSHPEHYDAQNGMNTPKTPYFFRRVRNVYDFAKGNGYLIENSAKPRIGDIVFYGRYHATMVTKVYQNGAYYDEIEADPKLIFVKKHIHKKWHTRDVARFLPHEKKNG